MTVDDKFNPASLPTKPSDALLRLVREYRPELGGEYTVARRVSRELPPDMSELRCGITRKRKRGWMAECTCTACGDSWYTHWVSAGIISVYEGPDSQIYEWTGEDIDFTEGHIVSCASPDTVFCPNCGEQTTLVFAADLRSPRRRTRAFQTVEVMGKYGAVVAWLATRLVDRDADITEIIVPWKAVVVDENRKLHSWSWNGRAWEPVKSLVRAELTIFNTPDGMCSRMCGTFKTLEIPALIGTTLEKTGLREYLQRGGEYPTEFLRFWAASANIENLMKTEFASAVKALMDQSLGIDTCNNASRGNHFELPINLNIAKPHLMLEMDKTSFRHFNREDAPIWSSIALQQWLSYRDRGGKLDAVRFYELWLKYKSDGIDNMLEMMNDVPGLDIDRIDWYLVGKQGLRPDDLHYLPDVWAFTRKLHTRFALTANEMWPRNLIAEHDRLSNLLAVAADKETEANFARVLDELGALEFTDGDLCIRLPRGLQDLVEESDKLLHCVKHYGDRHVSGNPVFFVRHYRRPERSYYTLSEDLTKPAPERLQLHGYRNDAVCKIPKKVLDFCDRWERAVLAPWWAERQRKEVTA